MKIGLLGNVNNNFLLLANILGEESDLDIYLYINRSEIYLNQPESDSHINNSCENIKVIYFSSRNIITHLLPAIEPLIANLNKLDLLFLSGPYVCLSPYLKVKTVFYPTGADLTRSPFAELTPILERRSQTKIVSLLRNIVARNYRKGILSTDAISCYMFFPFKSALSKIFKTDVAINLVEYLPLAINNLTWEKFSAEDDNVLPALFPKKGNFTIFCPSRIIDTPSNSNIKSGAWKNQSELIQGFNNFLSKRSATERKSIFLVFIDRAHSPDVRRITNFVKNLGITENVIFLKSKSDFGFVRNLIISMYKASSVVCDDFGVGWFGGVTLEAASLGIPVITKLDNQEMVRLFGSNPFYNTQNWKDIASHLEEIYLNPEIGLNVGERQRIWVEENFNRTRLVTKFRTIINQVWEPQ